MQGSTITSVDTKRPIARELSATQTTYIIKIKTAFGLACNN